ncbi:MAG TPA: outer membrane beta-barrel protein [Chitinophagaceae bacterium]
MKPVYLLALFTVISFSLAAQKEWGFTYSASLPQHEMKKNINTTHSLNAFVMSNFKGSKKLSWGVEIGFGQYAFFTKEQDIRFPDGSGIKTDVSYSSNVVNAGLLGRYNFFKEAKKGISPYFTAKLGYANFFSKVYVHDPEDEDDCKPLDKKTPIKDHSFFASYGAGLQIDVSGKQRPKGTWLDISVSQIHGTKLDYINVKDIKDHVHNDPNNPTPPTSDKSTPLTIKFVNVATQTIHEHQLAEVYNSPFRALQIKAGIVWRLDL